MYPGALLGERRQDLQRIGRSDEAVAGAGFEDGGDFAVGGVMRAGVAGAGRGEVAGDGLAVSIVEAYFQRDQGVFHPEGDRLRRVKDEQHSAVGGDPGAIHQAAGAVFVAIDDFGVDGALAVVEPKVFGCTGGQGGEGEEAGEVSQFACRVLGECVWDFGGLEGFCGFRRCGLW